MTIYLSLVHGTFNYKVFHTKHYYFRYSINNKYFFLNSPTNLS
jgi:hypothetical protein